MMHRIRHFYWLSSLSVLTLQIGCGDSSGPGIVATTLSPNSATTITAAPGAAVSELPSVIVHDQNGAPMAGVSVTFTVTGGGGSITGASQVTNAVGVATVGGWTLGSVTGTNTLVASSGNLPSVTFTANGVDPCTVLTNYAFGTSVNGTLSSTDCRLSDGSFIDFYVTTISGAGTYLFNQSASFDTFLVLFAEAGPLIALNDDIAATNLNSAIKAILPAGNYVIGATSFDPDVLGTYTLASSSTTAGVSNCEDAFVVKGITSSQELQTSDCVGEGFYWDDYIIFLTAGQSITATMTSPAIDSFLELYDNSGSATPLVSNDNSGASTSDAQISYTATVTGFYFISATSAAAGVTGPYTITVQ